MNKTYVYGAKNKAMVVGSEDGLIDYCDNLDSILEEENLIEHITNNKNEREKKLVNLETELKESKKEKAKDIILMLLTSASVTSLITLLNKMFTFKLMVVPIVMKNVLVTLLLIFPVIQLVKTINDYYNQKQIEKAIEITKKQIKYLNKRLPLSIEKLNKLKSESKVIEVPVKVIIKKDVNLHNMDELDEKLKGIGIKPKKRIRK